MRLLLVLSTLFASSLANRLFCYYGSWSVYRHGPGKYRVEDIDPILCTHLVYTFVGLDYNGKVRMLDPYNDIGDEWHEGAFTKLQRLRKINPNLKILAAIGGWNEGSEKYSRTMNDPNLRKVFVEDVYNFTLHYQFDGFDLDWEYPAQRGGRSSDRQAFSEMIAELHRLFEPKGLILTAAVTANALTAPSSYNCKDLVHYLDFINVMTYDLHGGWETVTGHQTAMYRHPKDSENERHLNLDFAMKFWIKCTGAPEKLNLGLAAYGRTFTLADPREHGVRAPASGPGQAGKYVGENGFLGYNEFCKERKEGLWKVYDIPEQDVQYAVKGNTWIGFDDPVSFVKKINYAKSLNVGGFMIWSIETDDFRGECGEGKYPLLRTVMSMLDVPPMTTKYPPVWSSTTQTPTPAPTAKPEPTTTARPNPTEPTPPPTTGDDYSYLCAYNGHSFRHPFDKSAFFICIYAGSFEQFQRSYQFKAIYYKCPNGLIFDEELKICNYA